MSDFKIIVPEATTNLVTNPSVEVDATGYTAVGGSIARSTAQSKWGVASLAITPTSGTADGAYYGTVSLTSGQTYTKSIWVLGVNGVPYRIYFGSTAGAVLGTPTTFTGTGEWQLVEVTYTETSTTTRRLYVVKNSSASTGVFYIDGLLCENKSYSTTYCDGSLVGNRADGYLWTGTAHASTSIRHAHERSGGRVRDMVDDLGVTAVNSFVGGGSPEETINTEELALLPGELYQNSKVGARFIDLGLTFKGSSVADLHADRKALKAAIKRNLVSPSQPFVFRYTGGPRTLEIDSWYAGGLEQKALKKYAEQTPLRLFCPQPFWRGLGQAAKSSTAQQTVSNTRTVIRRDSQGVWSSLGPPNAAGTYQDIRAIVEDATYVYFGGNFQNFDNIANADHVVRYNKQTGAWSALDVGLNSIVYALALSTNGDLYIGGAFTNAGGVAAADYLCRWDGSNFNAVGTPLTGAASISSVRALTFDNSGNLYIGGQFSNWADIAAADNLVMWNGSTYSALSTGANGTVYDLALMLSGYIAIGGEFTSPGNGVVQWTGSAFVTMSSGISGGAGIVQALAVLLNGDLAVGGSFTSPSSNLVLWNGSGYSSMGSPNDVVYSLAVAQDGTLITGGVFTSIGGLSLPDRVARWNRSSWLFLDVNLPGTPAVYAILASQKNDYLYLGFASTGTATTGVVTTVTYNGTADAFPRFVVAGPGRLYQLVNYTTGQAIYFDLSLNTGETVTLDLDPQQAKFTSTFRGNIIRTIINGSSVADWHLQPGDNSIGIFVDDATAVASLVWRELYEAADG